MKLNKLKKSLVIKYFIALVINDPENFKKGNTIFIFYKIYI